MGGIWNYFWPDYRFNFVFSLDNGDKPLYFLTIVNFFLFLGIMIALLREKGYPVTPNDIIDFSYYFMLELLLYFVVFICFVILCMVNYFPH